MTHQFGDSRLPERFWSKVQVNEQTGCWEWQGEVPFGYGRFFVRGTRRQLLAHRVSYEAFNGPIAPKLQIDHRCRVRSCVNPAHLEAVTAQVNAMRSPKIRKMIEESAERSRSKTHCPQGHAYEGDNLILDKRGNRICRECRRLAQAAYYAENAERRRAESRAYHEANRERRNAESRAYYHANKAKKKPSS